MNNQENTFKVEGNNKITATHGCGTMASKSGSTPKISLKHHP